MEFFFRMVLVTLRLYLRTLSGLRISELWWNPSLPSEFAWDIRSWVSYLEQRFTAFFSVQFHPEACSGPDDGKYLFQHFADGKITGLDIELAQMIVARIGMSLEIRGIEFSGLIPALQSGRVDFVMSAMTVTEERKKTIDFSQTYYSNTLALTARKGFQFQKLGDLHHTTIGAQLGSTMEKAGKDLAKKVEGMKILSLGRNPMLVEELKAGRIDAILMEQAQAIGYVKQQESLIQFRMPE